MSEGKGGERARSHTAVSTGWQTKPLGDLCDFQRGLTYSKGDEVESSGNIVLRATNIDLATNRLDFSELKYISDSVAVPDSKKVRRGSLIICTASGSKSHLGKVAFIDDDYGYAFGGFMGMITTKAELLPKFLFHLMTSDAYKHFIGALSDGANINNLKFDDLKQFSVPLPSLPEQRRIVGILDEALAGIATAKANAEKNLQNARALFESHLQAVFTQRGPEWVEKPLESVAGIMNGYAFKSTDFSPKAGARCIKITNVGVREFVSEADNYLPSDFGVKYATVTVAKGSIVLALTRTIISGGLKVAVVPEEYDQALLNQRVAAIAPIPRLMVEPFLFAYLSTQVVVDYVKQRVNTLMQPNLSIADLRGMPVPAPPVHEQTRIADQLCGLRVETQRLASLYQRKLAALDELKKSLLHQAFSGDL